jgi:hypothetical protein
MPISHDMGYWSNDLTSQSKTPENKKISFTIATNKFLLKMALIIQVQQDYSTIYYLIKYITLQK